MSVYTDSSSTGLKLNEQHIYGSSRLGMYTWGKAIAANAPMPQWLGSNNYTNVYDSILPSSISYELSNHLGNVLSVISDKKIGLPLNDSTVKYYIAEVLSQNDYYPFGMGMPGRKFNGGYRYGFNGKENDNDVKGEGNQQDYGMRIYDPRLGRFLSVDPITKEYPQLTPYQFASNRPIDGIDQDGLEYLTYTITIDLTGSKGSKIMDSYFVWYNASQHNTHGPLGKGVLYNVKFYNGKEKKFVGENNSFVSRGASTLGISTEYGNYMGATGLFEMTSDGHGFTKKYDYSLPAVDAVDNFAKQHDIGYDKLSAVGGSGLFDDWGTTPVDEAALNGWNNFLANSKVGSADPYNAQAVTKSERRAAKNAAILFDFVVSDKKGSISSWMQRNYKGEAANHSNKGMYGKKDMETNYGLFLNKYMQKDADGNWTRKENMWSKDKKGNWTPNKPKNK